MSILQSRYTVILWMHPKLQHQFVANVENHKTINRKPTGSNPWQLSNWTKHYRLCTKGKKRPATKNQDTLQKFFPVVSQSSIVSTAAIQASYQSTPGITTQTHSINPIFLHAQQFNPTTRSMLVPSSQFNHSMSLQHILQPNLLSNMPASSNNVTNKSSQHGNIWICN